MYHVVRSKRVTWHRMNVCLLLQMLRFSRLVSRARCPEPKNFFGWKSNTIASSTRSHFTFTSMAFFFNNSILVFMLLYCCLTYLRRQSLKCTWTSSLELSADGPQTAGLIVQPFYAVSEDFSIWSRGPKHSVNPPLNRALEVLLITYFLTLTLMRQRRSCKLIRARCRYERPHDRYCCPGATPKCRLLRGL